ncbi:MAG TPA: hypothetical protein VF458_17760 [Ktedonobacteraceae bacterium]
MIPERQRILLTGGRSFVALDLARQFARSGHEVIVAESLPVHLCRYSTSVRKHYLVPRPNVQPGEYIDELVRIIREEQIDLLLPTCEEIYFIARERERLSAYCSVFVASLWQMRALHSKWEFNQRALSYGLRVPETHLLTSQRDLQSFIAQNQHPFVLKPVFSRFATRVLMVEVAEQASRSFQHLSISADYPWVAQERIDGQLCCSYSVAHAGKLAAHAVYGAHFTAGQGACIQFEPLEDPGIDRWIEHFVAREQFTGQIAFDFIVTGAGEVYPLECNPRATSGIHLFCQDDDLPGVFLESDWHDQPVIKPCAGARAMIAPAMLVYGLPELHSWARLKEWLRTFTRARDVVFDWRDPGPFLRQPLILWYNWRGSRAAGISLQAFSTRDIEWNGQDLTAQTSQGGSLA